MNKLKELRKNHGINQRVLAEKLNVAQNTISQWENGKRDIDNKKLGDIAKLFDVSTDYLLGIDTLLESEKKATPAITTEVALKIAIEDKLGREPTQEEFLLMLNLIDSTADHLKKMGN